MKFWSYERVTWTSKLMNWKCFYDSREKKDHNIVPPSTYTYSSTICLRLPERLNQIWAAKWSVDHAKYHRVGVKDTWSSMSPWHYINTGQMLTSERAVKPKWCIVCPSQCGIRRFTNSLIQITGPNGIPERHASRRNPAGLSAFVAHREFEEPHHSGA